MSKREEFVKLPPYVDFRDSPSAVFKCTCGYVYESGGVREVAKRRLSHIKCPNCGGVAVKTKSENPVTIA